MYSKLSGQDLKVVIVQQKSIMQLLQKIENYSMRFRELKGESCPPQQEKHVSLPALNRRSMSIAAPRERLTLHHWLHLMFLSLLLLSLWSSVMETIEIPISIILEAMLRKLDLPSPKYESHAVGRCFFETEGFTPSAFSVGIFSSKQMKWRERQLGTCRLLGTMSLKTTTILD